VSYESSNVIPRLTCASRTVLLCFTATLPVEGVEAEPGTFSKTFHFQKFIGVLPLLPHIRTFSGERDQVLRKNNTQLGKQRFACCV
jgi:hypothetical protein